MLRFDAMRLAAFTLALGACLPTEDWPEADSDLAKSAFLAIELENSNGNFEIYASDLVNGKADFPTVLLDGDRRVDVYFFACSLHDLDPTQPAGRVRGDFTVSQAAFGFGPRPLQSRSWSAQEGRFVEDLPGPSIELKLSCPKARLAWSSDTLHVDQNSVWLHVEDTRLFVGSSTGTLYEFDSNGLVGEVNGKPIVAMAELDSTYFGVLKSGELMTGLAPADLEVSFTPDTVTTGQRLSLEAGAEEGTANVGAASTLKFRVVTPGGRWQDWPVRCTRCGNAASNDAFMVHHQDFGFVAGASKFGCLATSRSEDPVDFPEPCTDLGGLDEVEAGLVASLPGGIQCRKSTGWSPLVETSTVGRLFAQPKRVLMVAARSVMSASSTAPICEMEAGPLTVCSHPDLQESGRVLAVGRMLDRIVVLFDRGGVVVVSVYDLNTCSG